jgi:hypothetical protein
VVSRFAILLVQVILDIYFALLYLIRQRRLRLGHAANSTSLQNESRTCKITILLRNCPRLPRHFLIGSSLDLFNGLFGRYFDDRVLSLYPCSLSRVSSICQEGRRTAPHFQINNAYELECNHDSPHDLSVSKCPYLYDDAAGAHLRSFCFPVNHSMLADPVLLYPKKGMVGIQETARSHRDTSPTQRVSRRHLLLYF